jgi:hypothetical protein
VNNNPNIVSGGGGITIGGGGSSDAATLTLDVSHTTMRDALGPALGVGIGTGADTISGTIDHNTIGVAATANSGSAQGSDIGFSHQGGVATAATISITNNTLYQYNNEGILIISGDFTSGTGLLNLTVTGNTISNPGTVGSQGFLLDNGIAGGDANRTCLTLTRNSLTGSGANGATDIRLRQRFDTKVGLLGTPDYSGGPLDTAAVNSYTIGQNGGTPTVSGTVGNAGSGFFGSCPP